MVVVRVVRVVGVVGMMGVVGVVGMMGMMGICSIRTLIRGCSNLLYLGPNFSIVAGRLAG